MHERSAVRVLIENSEREVLLGQRGHGSDEGVWELIGGKREPEETVMDAAVRETLEEANTSITTLRLLGQHNVTYESETWHEWYFTGQATTEPTPDGIEITAVHFFSESDLAALSDINPHHRRILEEFFAADN